MKKLLIVLVFALPLKLYPNAAQPGIWNAGGTATFSLLFPEDSIAFKQIQMVKERIYVQLYKGFAVVKGNYWMYNATEDTIDIRVGYPINSFMESNTPNRTEVFFDSLYQLRATINGVPTDILTEADIDNSLAPYTNNWYVWNNSFLPYDTTLITVWFLVNTNSAHISKGYTKEKKNGFIYLLESGATWKQPIVDGEVAIQLMDGLKIEDIWGLSPPTQNLASEEKTMILRRFKDLTPTLDDNIVLTYGNRVDDFNFEQIVVNTKQYFNAIDQFSQSDLSSLVYNEKLFQDPYRVTSGGGWIINILYFVRLYGLIFLGLIILVIAILIIRKNRRKD